MDIDMALVHILASPRRVFSPPRAKIEAPIEANKAAEHGDPTGPARDCLDVVVLRLLQVALHLVLPEVDDPQLGIRNSAQYGSRSEGMDGALSPWC